MPFEQAKAHCIPSPESGFKKPFIGIQARAQPGITSHEPVSASVIRRLVPANLPEICVHVVDRRIERDDGHPLVRRRLHAVCLRGQVCQGTRAVALGGLDVTICPPLHDRAGCSAISSAPRGTSTSRSNDS